jgi:hypothetical protein
VLLALFLVRYLVPTEGTSQGTTLWIAVAWLAAGSLRAWWLGRFSEPPAKPGTPGPQSSSSFWTIPGWTCADLGVALLTGGSILSGLLVLLTQGDRRAALNGLLEWLAIGVSWLLLRGAMHQAAFRIRLLRQFCLITTALAVLGLWQHLYWYPQEAARLQQFLHLTEQIEQGEPLSRAAQSDYQKLKTEIGSQVLTLDAEGRQALLNRTLYSVEPIGRFALANSFAAILLVGLILGLQFWFHAWRKRSHPGQILCAGGIGLLLLTCLILTKSRTALVGLAVVAGVQVLAFSLRSENRKKTAGFFVAALVGLSLLIGLLFRIKGLDWQVLSEAPKSLTYRWEYWQATWKLILASPVFGVGPGNFRAHYLQFKLPASSEEISDPHNFLLDAWSQGGLLALVGTGLLVWSLLRQRRQRSSNAELPASTGASLRSQFVGQFVGLLAFAFVAVATWLFEGYLDETLLALAGIWLGITLLMAWLVPLQHFSRMVIWSAGAALTIHLLGSGGWSMPAILQLWLVLLLSLQAESPEPPRMISGPRWISGAAAAGAIVTGLAIWYGLRPVISSSMLLERGRQLIVMDGNERGAERLFLEAAQIDPLSAEPWQQLAQLSHLHWMRDRQNLTAFEAAIQQSQAAIDRDPFSGKRYLAPAEWWLERFEQDHDPAFARQALATAQAGLKQYPENSHLWAITALSAAAAGEPSRSAAEKALALDQLNYQLGHSDKWLPARQRAALQTLLDSAPDSQ